MRKHLKENYNSFIVENINEAVKHQIYTGKAKTVEILDEKKVRIVFRDDITAGDGAKKDNIVGKGKLGASISNLIFEKLEAAGIPTHTLEIETDTTVIARKLKIFPIEVIVRNTTAGSYCRRYGIEEGKDLDKPLIEYFLKDDVLHDPLIEGNVAINQKLVTRQELDLMTVRARQINAVLKDFFHRAGMILVDFKLEFGKNDSGMIYLADEISGDSMRVWDINTREKLDKDRFRKNLGDVLAGYREILDKLQSIDYSPTKQSLKAIVIISPKEGVTNPAGEITKRTLHKMGVPGLGQVLMGKQIQIELHDTMDELWMNSLNKTASELLTNPLIEDYQITFE